MFQRRKLLESSDLDDRMIRLVIRHLRSDLADDWFPDPVAWNDLLEPAFFRGVLLHRTGILGRRSYRPTERVERDVPKANGTLRYSLEQTLVDRFVYQYLVTRLALDLDPLISARVLSHRVRPRGSDGKPRKRLFKSGVAQWSMFEGLVAADVGPFHVVCADVQTFYEAIGVNLVTRALRTAISEASVSEGQRRKLKRYAGILEDYLIHWTYLSTHGLPQNRDASAFLANLVMRQVDQQMIDRGYDYFRYMDDIRIRCERHSDARKALARLCIYLREIGLSLNSEKTKINPPGSDWHKEQERPSDPRMRDIDNMWKSRSVQLLYRSFKYLSDLTADVIAKRDVGSRAFRFCVNRIERVYLCSDITFELPRADQLRRLSIDSLGACGYASEQLCNLIYLLGPTLEEIVEIEALLLDENEFLHDWQRFQLARLLLQIHTSDPEGKGLSARMVRAARAVLSDEGRAFPRDSAILVLGVAGDHLDRQRVARLFKTHCKEPYLQRAALIAVHSLDYDRDVGPYVSGDVVPHLSGSLRRFIAKCSGTYFTPPPDVPLSRIADNVDSYVG